MNKTRRPRQYRSDGICIICREDPIEPNRNSYCRKCRLSEDRQRWSDKTQEERISKWLRYRYNLTFEEYEAMFEEQGYMCRTCGDEIYLGLGLNSACVDHCHETDKVRGLLCHHCNRALGLIKENTETLENMLEYLGKHNG